MPRLPAELEADRTAGARACDRDEVRLLVAPRATAPLAARRFRDLPAPPAPRRPPRREHVRDAARPRSPAPSLRRDRAAPCTSRRRLAGRPLGGRAPPAPRRPGREPFAPAARASARAARAAPARSPPRTAAAAASGSPASTLPGRWTRYLGRARRADPLRPRAARRARSRDYQTVFAPSPAAPRCRAPGRPFTRRARHRPRRPRRRRRAARRCTPASARSSAASALPRALPRPRRDRGRQRALNGGGRVIAVGTTVVRALETAADAPAIVHAAEGWTNLTSSRPSAGVRAVDGLLTGWHEPEASHLLMLEAVAGRELLERSYAAAARTRLPLARVRRLCTCSCGERPYAWYARPRGAPPARAGRHRDRVLGMGRRLRPHRVVRQHGPALRFAARHPARRRRRSSWTASSTPRTGRRWPALIAAAVEHGTPYEFDLRVLLPGRGERWLHARARAVPGTDGRTERITGLLSDVTERRHREEAHAFLDAASAGAGGRRWTRSRRSRRSPGSRCPRWPTGARCSSRAETAALRAGRRRPRRPRQGALGAGAPGALPARPGRARPARPRSSAPAAPSSTRRSTARCWRPPRSTRSRSGSSRELQMHSVMVVPLAARDRTLGAITFVWAESGRQYSTRELELAEELGRRAGLALDHARLFDREHATAETLQRALLPARLPVAAGPRARGPLRPERRARPRGRRLVRRVRAARRALRDRDRRRRRPRDAGRGDDGPDPQRAARLRAQGRRRPAEVIDDLHALVDAADGEITLRHRSSTSCSTPPPARASSPSPATCRRWSSRRRPTSTSASPAARRSAFSGAPPCDAGHFTLAPGDTLWLLHRRARRVPPPADRRRACPRSRRPRPRRPGPRGDRGRAARAAARLTRRRRRAVGPGTSQAAPLGAACVNLYRQDLSGT